MAARSRPTVVLRCAILTAFSLMLAGLPRARCATVQGAPPSSPPPAVRQLQQEPGPSAVATQNIAAGDPPRLLANPFEEPRQLLQLLDIGPSEFHSFVDGQAISPVDEEALAKILFRMPQIEPGDIERWLHRQVPWDKLSAESAAQRGEFFLLQGRARRITRQALRPRLAGLFDFDHYYQVRIELVGREVSESVSSLLVCTRTIPEAWHELQELDERCRVTGMFIKLDANRDGQSQFLFAAPNIAWLPDRVELQLGTGPSAVLLGQLGMDVGLFDTVRSRNGLPIAASERECFYALLRAAERAAPRDLAQRATPLQLGALLQHPELAHGRLLTTHGSVQRITRVVLDEADIVQRYGIDHYYQLDVLVPVGPATVEIRSAAGEGKGPMYRDTFPLTCCCLSLPQPWQPLVGREKISVEARLTGFFFKLWAYPNPYVASFDERQRQLSPMLMLHEPLPLAPPVRSSRATGLLVGIGFLIVLATVWASVLLLNRSDRRRRSAKLQSRFRKDEPLDFQQLSRQDDAACRPRDESA